ncbi:MAG: hypothetical protein HYY02_12130 [Chloroflexi bacterium]|nr:hypothetical protein [Chloroflexota bacterium]
MSGSPPAYAQGVLDHGADQRWRFAVPADRTEALRQEVLALAPAAWQARSQQRDGVVRQGAAVPVVPSRRYEDQDAQPYGRRRGQCCWSGTGGRRGPARRGTR